MIKIILFLFSFKFSGCSIFSNTFVAERAIPTANAPTIGDNPNIPAIAAAPPDASSRGEAVEVQHLRVALRSEMQSQETHG